MYQDRKMEGGQGISKMNYKGVRYVEERKVWQSFFKQNNEEEKIIGEFKFDYEAALAYDHHIRLINGYRDINETELLNYPIEETKQNNS